MKVLAGVTLLCQIGLIALGLSIIGQPATPDGIRAVWYVLIPVNAIFGAVNIFTIFFL